ncbi:glucokinase [Pseudolysinimonas kribbensis]|uniref:Glucokinase n=1 Tax=Pseudolysinimonas kribbensis TaxID=433641 RepID=A0ABQ6K7J8_9MICO|nr:glucokinase [Pseudolysinimonas kribbensis]
MIAIDVGGTTIKGALVDAAGVVRATEIAPTPRPGAERTVLEVASRLAAAAPGVGTNPVAVGIVSPGIVDPGGVVRIAVNLDWRDLPLAQLAEDALGLPAVVTHDVRGAGVGELRCGAGIGVRDLAVVQLGTGIASALVVHGELVVGAGSAAGEVGHLPVIPGGERCACGQEGCVEAYASGGAIARRYAARTGRPATAEQIVGLLGGDADADAVWAEAITALGRGVLSIVALLDPALVVLGGGVAAAGDALLEPLRGSITGTLTWRECPPIVVSPLGAEAGRLGAAVLAFERAGIPVDAASWRRA